MGLFRFLRTILFAGKKQDISSHQAAIDKSSVISLSSNPPFANSDLAVRDASSLDQEARDLSYSEEHVSTEYTAFLPQRPMKSSMVQPTDEVHEQMLRACSTGDIHNLHTLFSSLSTTAPHPEIMYLDGRQPLSSGPPSTFRMLHASVREQQVLTLKYLLEVFPTTKVSHNMCDEALFHCNIAIWTVLLEHDRSFLNRKIDCRGCTIFSLACWSMKPELPMLMLEYGADPNVSGLGPLSILGLAIAEQPIELIQSLVERGAEPRGHLDWAVRCRRSDVVSCLLDAGISFSEIQNALRIARKEGTKNITRLLRRRKRELQWEALQRLLCCLGH